MNEDAEIANLYREVMWERIDREERKEHEGLVDDINYCANLVKCLMCDGHIFVADDEYGIVWSHLEDTGCDDPTPKENI